MPLMNRTMTFAMLSAFAGTALADANYPIPWVAGVTKDSVYVCLEATTTANATVQFGTTAAYGLTATTENFQATDVAASYVHNVKLTGLQPNTKYNYRVTHGGTVTANYEFWTAPLPGTPVRWGFAADSRPGVSSWHNTIAGLIAGHAPRLMVYGGDLANSGTQRANWISDWFQPNQAALNATTPWVNSPGNHETWGDVTKAFTQSPTGDPDYFSFDYGDAHILVLNSMTPHGRGSDQWNFAAADLAATSRAWKIVVTHYPPYVYRDGYGLLGDADNRAMAAEVFEPNGVDMVLSGDAHFYQHLRRNGIEYMVLGSFGSPLYTPTTGPEVVYTEKTFNFGIFDMTPTTLTLNAYRGTNTLIETISLTKAVPEPAALAVAGVLAAAGAVARAMRRRARPEGHVRPDR